MVFNYLEINSFFGEKYSFFGKNLVWSYTDWPASQGGELLTTVPIDEALKIGYHGGYSRLILRGWTRVELTHFLCYTWKQRLIQIKMHSKILLYSSTTLRFLFYVLVLLYAGYVLFDFFLDGTNHTNWMISIKIQRTGFITTIIFFLLYLLVGKLPPFTNIRTGWSKKYGLKLSWNIYKTSTYNRNLRVFSTVV